MDIINVILGSLAAIFQFVAAYFGYRIYKFNRLNKWWLALVLAFIVQGIRRIFTVFEDVGSPLIASSAIFDRTLMFIISLLIVVGLWAMMKNFENFEVITGKISEKVKRFKK